MPGKMKELLDGLGVRADRRSFEHAVVGGDREYGAVVVVVKEEEGDGVGGGEKEKKRRGVLFPPPSNEGFD